MRQMLKEKFIRKLYSNSGESIAETLVTMIVLSLAVLMLAGAVVTAARIDKKADNTDTAFVTGEEIDTAGTRHPTVTIAEKQEAGSGNSVSLDVSVYETKKNADKSYYYYNIFKIN